MIKRFLRVQWLRFIDRMGFKLTTSENSEIASRITRNVTTPPGMNAHDACEEEWEVDNEVNRVIEELEHKLG